METVEDQVWVYREHQSQSVHDVWAGGDWLAGAGEKAEYDHERRNDFAHVNAVREPGRQADALHHRREEPDQELNDLLRAKAFRQPRKAADIAEHHGHFPLLAAKFQLPGIIGNALDQLG